MKKKKITAIRLLEIMEWIENYCNGFSSYSVDDYGVVNIKGDLIIHSSKEKISKIEVEFGKVSGSFVASYLELTSLKNCPKRVMRNYVVSCNRLRNFKYAPEYVGDSFYCRDNRTSITSFEGLKNIKGKILISISNCCKKSCYFSGDIESYNRIYGDKK